MLSRRDFMWAMGVGATAALIDWRYPAQAAITKAGPGEYDAIIIGAGLGGLSCGALLAGNGFRPLVLESHYVPGGYASSFTRKSPAGAAFQFEVSLHATAATTPSSRKLYQELGVADALTFVPHKHVWCSRYPDGAYDILPAGLDGFRELLRKRFPDQAKGLNDFFNYWKSFLKEMERLEQEGMPADKMLFPARYPTLWDIRNKTLADVVNRSIADPRLRDAIGQSWGYYGLPPARLAAFYYLVAFAEYLEYGGHYLKGTSQTLSRALAERIKAKGGEVRQNERVTEILCEGTRAVGVRTASGKAFRARAVVSNAAVPETVALVKQPELIAKGYRDRLNALQPSLSSCVVWLGLNRDVTQIEARAEIALSSGYDPEIAYAASLAGEPEKSGVGCMIYDNLVKGFSPAGKSTVSLMCLCGYEPWRPFEADYLAGRKEAYRKAKDDMAKRLIAIVEARLIPGLSRMIEVQEASTPLTNRRFTGNTAGSLYGFDQTSDNTFMTRLAVRTPLAGLYLAGAWSDPGGGYGGALLGGKNAFKALIEDWS